MDADQIRMQSESATKQWGAQWRKHAARHNSPKFNSNKFSDFLNIGVGRTCVAIANGYSFEENLDILKKFQHNVDIIVCDKTLGHCLEHGIVPTYCMVSDANVDYEKYLLKYKDKLQNTILFINVCANPKWSHNGNWKKIYCLVHKDILKNELEFSKLSGCENIVVAGTNVSNMMIIILTQSDSGNRQNYFGYDKIVLLGYDYSWRIDGKYYAFDEDANGKRNYMSHIFGKTKNGSYCNTSNNLLFSANWLSGYIRTFRLPVVLGSSESILDINSANLEKQLSHNYKREDRIIVQESVKRLKTLAEEMNAEKEKLNRIGMDHYFAHAASL